MMEELNLYEKYYPVLLDNGFDEWISLCELNEQTLEELGVLNAIDREQIMACLKAADTVDSQPDNQPQQKSHYKEDMSESIAIGDDNVYRPGFSSFEGESKEEEVRAVPLVVSKIEKWSYKKKNKEESEKSFFGRILHLYIKQSGINSMVRPCSMQSNLDRFPSLKVLDLSSNDLIHMGGMDSLISLETLNLEKNKLRAVSGLENCRSLKKILLTKNCIRRLEGLHFCNQVEAIYLSHQRISSDEYLEFDEDSIIGVSDSLRLLEANDSRVREVRPLQYLRRAE